MLDEKFYRENIYGSSRFGGVTEAKALSKGTAPIGVFDNITLRRRNEEPTIIFGGAGSGKGANIGIYHPVHPSTKSFFLLDMGGQYMSTTWHQNLAEKRHAYAINVEGASAYADINHPVDLWAILKPDDPMLFDNARRIAAMALRDDAKGDNAWVGQSGRRWICRLLLGLVLMDGRVTPSSLWRLVNLIDCDDEAFKDWSRQTENLPYDIYSTMIEIYSKKHGSEKEYGAIMGLIKDSFDWLSSPTVAQSVSGDEDYLAYLCDPNKKVGIYYALRGGSGKVMMSLTRMIVGIAMLHCMRANTGSRPLFYLEEAATMGAADFIKQAVSECRKYIDTVLVYQSQGQIINLFGKAGAQEIIESCGMQIVLGGGVRDIESAKRFSEMLGKATLEIDDPIGEADRQHRANKAREQAIWQGHDPILAEAQYRHEMSQSQRKKRTSRSVLDPTEVMRLKNHVLIFTPGLGLRPILAHKLPPYWENRHMAGKYAPDPLFPPMDQVTIRHPLWGKSKRPFIREAVPNHLAHLPNHSNGQIAYVKGYKTW